MAAGWPVRHALDESGCLGLQPQMGGKFHLKLNIGTRPIANKYREGKMKSTLKRELKARETVEREAIEVSNGRIRISRGLVRQIGAFKQPKQVMRVFAVHLFYVLVSIGSGCRIGVIGW